MIQLHDDEQISYENKKKLIIFIKLNLDILFVFQSNY